MRCAKLNRSSFIPKGGEPLFLLIMSGQTAPFVYINHFPAILHSITCGAVGGRLTQGYRLGTLHRKFSGTAVKPGAQPLSTSSQAREGVRLLQGFDLHRGHFKADSSWTRSVEA